MPLVTTDANEAGQAGTHEARRNRAWTLAKRWWFLVVIGVALIELGLHFWQTRDVIRTEHWTAVKEAVQVRTQAEDLIVAAPSWVDPLARTQLGDALMTTERVARADESRFPAATEVAFNGARHPALSGWKVESESPLGPFVVRRLSNPAFRPVIDDLVDHMGPTVDVSTVTGDQARPCVWRKGAPATGPLGFGPAAPAERFQCNRGAWVGETIVADLEYAPRRCIYAPPPGGRASLRLRFEDVRFGKRLEGHHALYVEAERDRKGPPVRIAFSSSGKPIGQAVHEDGEGWSTFGFDTTALADTRGELTAEITSASGHRRMYCFEATTR